MKLNATVHESPGLKRLYDAEYLLARCAEPFGLKLRITSPELRAKLPEVSDNRILRAAENLEMTASTFMDCRDLGIDPKNDAEFFKLSMRTLGATYPANFLSMLKDATIIEAYDVTQFQVFRNYTFMQSTSYSLAEVMAFEWFKLFERTQEFNDELMKVVTEKIWLVNQAIPMSTPAHHLREVYGSQQRVKIEFKTITPLFSGPERPFGVAVTSNATIEKD